MQSVQVARDKAVQEAIQKGELNAGDAEAKHSGVQSELMLVLFHLLSVQMMTKLQPRTKNAWRTLQKLKLLVSNKVNSWRTKNLSCFVYLPVHSAFSFIFDFHVC